MKLISLKELYILVHRDDMLILCLRALFIVYLVFCVEHVQHTYVLFFGIQRQNYAFDEIENWMQLANS